MSETGEQKQTDPHRATRKCTSSNIVIDLPPSACIIILINDYMPILAFYNATYNQLFSPVQNEYEHGSQKMP